MFIKAYQGLRSLKRWDNFMGWLYRSTVNQCKNWLRANSRRPDGEFTEDQEPYVVDHPAMDSYREYMLYESVREALASVPETYREVMTLRYFGGLTIKEMARFLGVSPNTIDRRLKEARVRLKAEMVAMVSAAYEQHELPANFTFRMVEMVKRIRIHPVPRSPGLPWGISLAAGIMVVVMTLGSQIAIRRQSEAFVFSGEVTPEVKEMSVDILSGLQKLFSAVRQADISIMAPAMGGGTWTQKADMPTGRMDLSISTVNGKIYAIGGSFTAYPWETVPAVEEYDTGFISSITEVSSMSMNKQPSNE